MPSPWARRGAPIPARRRLRPSPGRAPSRPREAPPRRWGCRSRASRRSSARPPRSARAPPFGSCRDRSAAEPSGDLLERLGSYVVVGPEAAALGVDDPGLAEDLQVVGHGRLPDVEERRELANADLARVLAQDVHELEADRIAERLGHGRHPLGLPALDVRVDDGLAAGLAGGALLLGGELQIDRHRCTYID